MGTLRLLPARVTLVRVSRALSLAAKQGKPFHEQYEKGLWVSNFFFFFPFDSSFLGFGCFAVNGFAFLVHPSLMMGYY